MKLDHPFIKDFEYQRDKGELEITAGLNIKEVCKKKALFPIRRVRWNGLSYLLLAMTNPQNQFAIDEVEFITGLKVLPVLASDFDILFLQKSFLALQEKPKKSHSIEYALDRTALKNRGERFPKI